jgi:hypothetical protein
LGAALQLRETLHRVNEFLELHSFATIDLAVLPFWMANEWKTAAPHGLTFIWLAPAFR